MKQMLMVLLSFIAMISASPIGITRAIIEDKPIPIPAPTPIITPSQIPQQIPSVSMVNQIPYQRPVLSQYVNQLSPPIHRHYGNYYEPIRQSIVNPYIRPVVAMPMPVNVQPAFQPLTYTIAPTMPIINTVPVAPTPSPALISTEEIDSEDICQIRGRYNQLCLMKFSNVDDHHAYSKMFKCLPKAICAYRQGRCQWLKTRHYNRCVNHLNNIKDYLIRLDA